MRCSVRIVPVGVLVAPLLAVSVGCYSATSGSPGTSTGSGAPVDLSGSVVDKDSNQPVAGSIVIVEVGGLYQPNADTSKGNPFYRLSALVGPDGSFSVQVPSGMVGLHTFQNGYFYGVLGPVDVAAATAGVVVNPKTLLPMSHKPVATGFSVTPATIAPGGSVVLAVDVVKADPGGASADPLSEEIIAAETTTHWAGVLDPPTPGKQGIGFPDGRYTKTIAAPSAPGDYTYTLVVSSEGCVTSDRVTATLTVK
jgi:hypothetical protein